MFSNQKKSFFKTGWFYGMVVVFLLAFGIWINYDGESQNTNTATKVDQETQSETQSTTQDSAVVDSRQDEPSEEPTDETGSIEETQQPYYLIREVAGVVKVFYCTGSGEESLYQITTVPFDLLSTQDQQMLAEGVHVNTKGELADFLENFDS